MELFIRPPSKSHVNSSITSLILDYTNDDWVIHKGLRSSLREFSFELKKGYRPSPLVLLGK